jgi:hypothetical protein
MMKHITSSTTKAMMLLLSLISSPAFSADTVEPIVLYSGPLFMWPGVVTPLGKGFAAVIIGQDYENGEYDREYNKLSLPLSSLTNVDTFFNYGLTDKIDTNMHVRYQRNSTEGHHGGNLGDSTFGLGFQILKQNRRRWPPSIKFYIRQLFPTGRFNNLNVDNFGTEATGVGSYLTRFALNMEHVTRLTNGKHTIEFASVTLTRASRVGLRGFSIYGGGPQTHGNLWPGNSILVNLGIEYLPCEHWGVAMQGMFYAQIASTFRGTIGPTMRRLQSGSQTGQRQRVIVNRLIPTNQNIGAEIGDGNIAELTLIPAVNYFISKNVSISGGVWFSIHGKNTPSFYSPMIKAVTRW